MECISSGDIVLICSNLLICRFVHEGPKEEQQYNGTFLAFYLFAGMLS